MQPMVTLVGTMPFLRISRHSSQAPATSLRKPQERTRLPNVWAPMTCTPRPLRCRARCSWRRSARLMRMQASHTELNNTSSMVSCMESTKAMMRCTSLGLEDLCMPFRRMEQVTLFGFRPEAFISSMSCHTLLLSVRIVASMSSLKVTQLGARLPPAVRMVSMAARALLKSPRWRCFLMMVLYVTTSAEPVATASAMTRSAAFESWQSVHASRSALYRQAVFSEHALKTSIASAKRFSEPRLLISCRTCREPSGAARTSCTSTSCRQQRSAASVTRRPARASASTSMSLRHSS
mmetsp:Transcript_4471/g.14002  ORF Transcript_4471/g.14002 Transcript_4471/m.14002 type:complete len:293 (-) Transcript_4471:399-1277(-)